MKFFAFLTLLIFLPALGAEEIVRRPADESFREEASGLEFPARIETYEKVLVRKNPNPAFGTDVAYENEYGAFADVYIYRPVSADGKPEAFVPHTKSTVHNILSMRENSALIRKVEQLNAERKGLPESVFYAKFLIAVEKETVVSHLLMFEKNGFTVKIRVSYPADVDTEESSALAFENVLLRLSGFSVPDETKNEKP